ncbi:hypothetical protein QL285_008613 [Trifolium repens]|nr:hypothetical protein QL285_008613 [Trifolium repens]
MAVSTPSDASVPDLTNSLSDFPSVGKESTKSGLTHSLTIKLDEKNFLLWNQQVEGVITAHDLHRFILNPQIPLQYASVEDRIDGKSTEEYRKWIFKDQSLFTWLLSTLSDSVLPRVLGCKHAFQVWDKIHKYFNSVLKARARQLRSELKNTKKASRSISEYLLRIKSLVNSLIAVGDNVTEQEQIDAILDGLPEDFNSFVMMMYSKTDTFAVEDLEALLLLQVAQFDKFRQELATPAVSANIAQTQSKIAENSTEQDSSEVGTEHYFAGRGKGRGKGKGKGRGRGRGAFNASSQGGSCQICSKPNHDATICWYRYDANPNMPSQGRGFNAGPSRPRNTNPYMNPSANLALPYYPPQFADTYVPDTQSEASWYPDSGASHHLTYNPHNLMQRSPYNGNERVMMGNGQGVSISSLGHSSFYSKLSPNVKLNLKDLLHVPTISKNLLSVSKFAKDNNVIFEFHPYKCFVKSQASRQILLEGHVGEDGLYQFQPFQFVNSVGDASPSHVNKIPASFTCNNALYSANTDSDFHKWHLRLGHAHS